MQQGERILSAGTGDDRNGRDVGGLVTEGDSKTQGQEDGKPKDPEDDFRLAFEFKQAGGQQMDVS